MPEYIEKNQNVNFQEKKIWNPCQTRKLQKSKCSTEGRFVDKRHDWKSHNNFNEQKDNKVESQKF